MWVILLGALCLPARLTLLMTETEQFHHAVSPRTHSTATDSNNAPQQQQPAGPKERGIKQSK